MVGGDGVNGGVDGEEKRDYGAKVVSVDLGGGDGDDGSSGNRR